MAGISDKAWAAGWNVVRLNQRNCGETEHLSRGLYHSGLTHDPLFVLRELVDRDGLQTLAIAGYSLGGNLALKLAGELGDDAAPRAARRLCRLADDGSGRLRRGARAALEHSVSVQLRAQPQGAHAPEGGRLPRRLLTRTARRVWTVRQFDELYTAPHHGFRDAADYYHRASAVRVIDRIRVPTLILTAANDPFVPIGPFQTDEVASHPHSDRRDYPGRRPLRLRRSRRAGLRRLLGGARGGPLRRGAPPPREAGSRATDRLPRFRLTRPAQAREGVRKAVHAGTFASAFKNLRPHVDRSLSGFDFIIGVAARGDSQRGTAQLP